MSKISICVPTYNGEQHLAKTLECLTNQTYSNFEIIIVDDKSTDKTIEIAEDFYRKDNRIKIHKNNANLGLVPNWNQCIKIAAGEWIKFVFQDDLITLDCLEKMMSVADEKSLFISCYRDFLFDPGVSENIIDTYNKYTHLSTVFGNNTVIDKNLFAKTALTFPDNFVGEPTSTLLHKSLFEKYGYFNPNFIQLCDIEYWIRIGIHEGMTIVPLYLAKFRVHPRSTSSLNAEIRFFRAHELEDLLLLHEFAYNPSFKALHNIASLNGIDRNLRVEFSEKAYWFKNLAKERSKQGSAENELSILKLLSKQYPNFSFTWHMIPLILDGWLKKVFWRFYS
ncbi:MAG: glycosyltransferase family 2 protein [Methylomonas sp.]|nr:glycosyltransferase family 2 protein [Methylomonas sp.]PPD22111.1 MAG: hypothetical protein CTY23_03395 [Methylomonas sp.]PPD42402.1 MAG: hypothetical protein CTY17_01275 [Methylomonas sp.]PPD53112.1 MAG: hypothetical protein CTY11_07355 [Methylomonas sp.]